MRKLKLIIGLLALTSNILMAQPFPVAPLALPQVTTVVSRTVTLRWQKNDEPDITGYILYWGPKGGAPIYVMPVGNVDTTSVVGITGATSFFLTAVNNRGVESDMAGPADYDPAKKRFRLNVYGTQNFVEWRYIEAVFIDTELDHEFYQLRIEEIF